MDSFQEKLIELLYTSYYDSLRRYACSILGDWQLAEDAVQKTFEIALKKNGQFMDIERPLGWLTEIMKNVLRNMLRERARNERLFQELGQLKGSRPAFTDPMGSLYHSRPRDVSEEDFEIFLQIMVHGYTYEETVRRQGISRWASYKRVERTKKKLKKFFISLQ